MRNGNIPSQSFFRDTFLCSYPTYEEWKQLFLHFSNCHFDFGSYPTYEEWKQGYALDYNAEKVEGSYPTYEEWKL